MADVRLPRSLVALFPGTPRRLEASGATVADVLADLDVQVPGIRNRLVDAGPMIRQHINIFVAGQRATLATAVPPDGVVHVVPAVSGGSVRPASVGSRTDSIDAPSPGRFRAESLRGGAFRCSREPVRLRRSMARPALRP